MVFPSILSFDFRCARLAELCRSSATSFCQRASRTVSTSPVSSAARTAHPGSVSCWQWLNRHCLESAWRSEKLQPRRNSTSVSCSSRMPGVSRTAQPSGSMRSWRLVVVWWPLASSSRMACVSMDRVPDSALISVDLPTPDDLTSGRYIQDTDMRQEVCSQWR